MLPRIAEYGGGSPCGGDFYGDDVWPEKYRGCLFWAEWGQRVVRAFRFAPEGASFKIAEKIEFVEAGPVDSFRPLDLAFSHDGKTLYIADWSLGSWGNKTEKLGRVYAVTFAGADAVKTRPRGKRRRPDRSADPPARPSGLSRENPGSSGAHATGQESTRSRDRGACELEDRSDRQAAPAVGRGRAGRRDAGGDLPAAWSCSNRDVPDLRAQAARAWANSKCRLRWHARRSRRCCETVSRPSGCKRRSHSGGSGRRRRFRPCCRFWPRPMSISPTRLGRRCRRIDEWKAAAKGLDSPDPRSEPACCWRWNRCTTCRPRRALAAFASSSKRPLEERTRAIAYLAEVHRKAPPWDGHWWGTQPASQKPPAKTIAWEGTPRVMSDDTRAS